MQSDFLVIGSGIAGLSFALRAASHGTVCIITKGESLDSNTAWAQGGISAVLSPELRSEGDTFETHVADTLDAGAGLCKEDVVRSIVEEGTATIDDLLDYGVQFDKVEDSQNFALGNEGGHTKRRVLHSKDTTGYAIASSMLERAKAHPNITLLENHFAIDLITSGRLGYVTEDRVLGAYVLNEQSGEVQIFRSHRIVLATGGCGKVYLYTTNPDSATGDGIAMAWRAGATISNMEFMQFHPTCFYNPAAVGAKARSFLVSEAVRGEGGKLINSKGKEFTLDHDPRGSLAPRDIVARAIDHEIKKTGASCVYLDVTHKPKGFMKERFPNIYNTLLSFGLDCETAPIPVVPAAHYLCGGVVTNDSGKTSIRGLYAVGEVGCTGLHGANRLASNSLLEGNVVARRALDSLLISQPLNATENEDDYQIREWQIGDATPIDEQVLISHNWDELRRLMWNYVSIVRTDNRLSRAAHRLRNLRKEVRGFYWGFKVTRDIIELRNLVTTASLIVDCANQRKESRGIHYTLDYPRTSSKFERDTEMRRF
ncbi:L-aspartate oxidase [Rubritalea marina]|uniref:L-aspartate oxidase n=1 Tax=Rubritalea marina TaxID=361055 RepID=UPI0003607B47|nr:L-aspartate oxidase [Rubritalea marina]